MARLRLVARGPHNAFALARRDERTGEGKVFPVSEHGVERERVGMFVDRDGLARQRGFIYLQTLHLDQPQIGGHAVAGLEQHHVAGNELLRVDALFAAIAAHAGLGRDHAGQR